ncbi:MAG: hypothetical protein ABSF23_10585 [Terracidiphilus sp.]
MVDKAFKTDSSLSMLTARQYEGIGRFTIAFNEIDEVVKAYLPLVVQYSKCTLPPPHNAPRKFHARSVALRMALGAASAVDPLAGACAANILKFLDMADIIAAKRNQYVHAVAFIDFRTNTRMLQMRSGAASPDEKQIFDLASEAAFVAVKLAEECETMLKMYLDMDQVPLEFASPEGWDEDIEEERE